MPEPTTRRQRPRLAVPIVVVLTMVALIAAMPGTALGATTLQARCDGVNLRTRPTTTATVKVRIREGTRVGVTAKVTGGRWSTRCAGRSATGSAWYRITSINGRSVKSRFGIAYVYAAVSLFKPYHPPTPAPTPTPTPTPSPDSGYIEGIDVSHWQGPIDWARVAASGRKFAFMKASDSTTYVDPTYPTNDAGARAAGLVVGAYHFARPDLTPGDAVAEADHFANQLRLGSGDLPPVLDLEQTGGLGVPDLHAWVEAFLEQLYVRTGVRGIIYVSPSFWTNRMGNSGWFAAHGYNVLWIAHWTTAPEPWVPADNWGGKGWTFWQYTSDGSVPGIGGRVDLDRYRFDDLGLVTIP